MGHKIEKTTYKTEEEYGEVKERTLYARFDRSTDRVIFYDENDNVIFGFSDTLDNNLFNALNRLYHSKERELLIKLLASITLCDHIGDVLDDVETVLEELGIEEYYDDGDELREVLKKHFSNLKTLYGIEL